MLGQGDLLITMLGESLLRVHGPFVKTEEVQSVVNHLKKQGEPEYLQSVTKDEEESENFNLGLTILVMNFTIRQYQLYVGKRKPQQALSRDTCKLVIIVQRE